jgi:hypothetical protein
VTLRDNGLPGFKLTEADMLKQGKYFSERLKLFLEGRCIHKYNKKINLDASNFQLIEYNTPSKFFIGAPLK